MHASPSTFKQHLKPLHLSLDAAEILGHVQVLTTAITTGALPTLHLRNSAAWLFDFANSNPSIASVKPSKVTDEDLIYRAIHLTTLVYTKAISTLTPFSSIYTTSQLREVHALVIRVGFSKWKEIPGIFLWIMFVACSAGDIDPSERILERKLRVAGVAIACVNFDIAHAYFKGFWDVQRWIASESQKGEDVLRDFHDTAQCNLM